MKKLYAIVVRSHEYHIVGPFKDTKELEAWGDKETDPRWQSIELSPDNLNPEVHTPEWRIP